MMNLPQFQMLAKQMKACIEQAQEVTVDGYEPYFDNQIRTIKQYGSIKAQSHVN